VDREGWRLLEGIGSPALGVGADGRLSYVNVGARALLNGRVEAAIGQPAAEVLRSLGADEVADAIALDDKREGWSGAASLSSEGASIKAMVSVGSVLGEGSQTMATIVTIKELSSSPPGDLERKWLEAIVESSADPIICESLEGNITSWNAAAESLYGYSEAEVLGRHISLLVPEEKRKELDEIMAVIARGEKIQGWSTVRLRKDGERLNVLLNEWPLVGDDGAVMGLSMVVHDMTEQTRAAEAREDAEARFQAAFRRSTFGMLTADLSGYVTAANIALCTLLGRGVDELIGRPMAQYLHPDEAHIEAAMFAAFRRGAGSHNSERRYVRRDGSVVWLSTSVSVVRDSADEPLYLMAQLQDVSERKRVEQELEHRALHDDLTGLPNRALLDDRVLHALAAAQRSGAPVGVLFIDLDDFKHVNDALGHVIGDRVLIEVGRRLITVLRPSDTVARFGGDEFVVVCENVTRDALARLAERVIASMQAPITISGRELRVGASVGLTLSRPETTAQSLLSEADAAMYRAKDFGRGRYVVFDESLRSRAEAMLVRERALRTAIERNEVIPYYQPVMDLRTGRMVGLEALARWCPPKGRVVPPSEFVPLAESSGLISELDQAVLRRAAAEVQAWNKALSRQLWLSVNLSGRRLAEPALAEDVINVLEQSGLPGDLLHLEVTETVLVSDVEVSVPVLNELKEHGVGISIDDFGTGYGSLAYLRKVAADTLKIDRSFVADAEGGEIGVIKGLVGLTRAMGMTAVVEGVETEAQRAAVLAAGCHLAQGYYWCPPMLLPEVQAWAEEQSRLPPPLPAAHAVP